MILPFIVPVILQAAGIAVLLAEIMLPSGGLLTIIAIGCLGYSLYMVFTTVSTLAGMVFVLADIIVVPVVIIAGLKLLARSPLALRTSLSSKSGYSSFDEKSGQYIGKTGRAATDLRPSGTAIIDDKRVDVVTRGDYIEKGSQIRVIDVEGSRVVVRKTES